MARRKDDTVREIEAEGPAQGDLVTTDHVRFFVHGEPRCHPAVQITMQTAPFSEHRRSARSGDVSDAGMWRQLDEYMDKQKFWPNVWFVSDHGNFHLMTRRSGRGLGMLPPYGDRR